MNHIWYLLIVCPVLLDFSHDLRAVGVARLRYGWYNAGLRRKRNPGLSVQLSQKRPFIVIKRQVQKKPFGNKKYRLFRPSPQIFEPSVSHITRPIRPPRVLPDTYLYSTVLPDSLLHSSVLPDHSYSHTSVLPDQPVLSGYSYKNKLHSELPGGFGKKEPNAGQKGHTRGFHNYVIHHKSHLLPSRGHDYISLDHQESVNPRGKTVHEIFFENDPSEFPDLPKFGHNGLSYNFHNSVADVNHVADGFVHNVQSGNYDGSTGFTHSGHTYEYDKPVDHYGYSKPVEHYGFDQPAHIDDYGNDEVVYKPVHHDQTGQDGCRLDDGRFFSGGQSWELSDCGLGICAKALTGGWKVSFERCDTMLQNPQYTCVFDTNPSSTYPDCCPKPVQCRDGTKRRK